MLQALVYLSYLVYRLATGVVGRLPIDVAFALGEAIGAIGWAFAPRYRRLACRNLARALGPGRAPAEIRKIARRHFRLLAANICASARLARMPFDQIRERVEIEGLDRVLTPLRAGRGVVLVIGHFGNWELYAQLLKVLEGTPAGTIYRRIGNRFIEAHVRLARSRFGVRLFERKEGFEEAIRLLREGGMVAVLADQHAGQSGVWAPFFDRLASSTPLPALMALRSGAAMIPCAAYTVGRARWRCVVEREIGDGRRDVATLTAIVNRQMEAQIRENPADWFWVHDRWKITPNFLLGSYRRGAVLPPDYDPARLQPFRIAVRSPNWLGDAIMSVPAVRAFKTGRPDARVAVVAPSKIAAVWRLVPEVDEVIEIPAGAGPLRVGRMLRAAGPYDVAVLLPNSLRVALEAWLGRIPHRLGYAGHGRRRLLQQVINPPRTGKPPRHQAERALDLARRAGAKVESVTPFPAAPRDGDGGAIPIIGICPGAEYGPAKRWPPDRFLEVARAVAARRPCRFRVFGTRREMELGAAIASGLGDACADLVGRTTLEGLVEGLRECRALLTNDTGTMHLAAFLGTPSVAIFGSTEPLFTGPLGARDIVVRRHAECSPCFLRRCPIDLRCMREIPTGAVVDAVLSLL